MAKEVDLLANWAVLNTGIQKLPEAACAELLRREKRGKKRIQFLIRIYGRFNRLRTQRERTELVAGE